jgi:hypothetical protein
VIEKLYKFKVLFKFAFKHLKIKFIIIFLIFNILTLIDVQRCNTAWINLILMNIGLIFLYCWLMIYLMYPPISGSLNINGGKKWNINVPIKVIRKHKLKKLNKKLKEKDTKENKN